jgi:branched-subunit amino acid aminotransferase/4-amino-4-deoxychorismate lyase
MLQNPATFAWRDDALVPDELEPHRGLVVADSWLVPATGRVRALEAHRERFLGTAAETAPEAAMFWDAAVARLRGAVGAPLFPRVELATLEAGRTQLRLRIRNAPALHKTLTIASADGRDVRTSPRVKGPDIEALEVVRAAARDRGADEAVLLDRSGHVVDGASTAVLWWRGESLLAPPSDLARVASVTARSIRLIAGATGVRVSEERARPADLTGCEVWAVNALHGIRVVDGWIDGPALTARPSRAEAWRRRLDTLARAL